MNRKKDNEPFKIAPWQQSYEDESSGPGDLANYFAVMEDGPDANAGEGKLFDDDNDGVFDEDNEDYDNVSHSQNSSASYAANDYGDDFIEDESPLSPRFNSLQYNVERVDDEVSDEVEDQYFDDEDMIAIGGRNATGEWNDEVRLATVSDEADDGFEDDEGGSEDDVDFQEYVMRLANEIDDAAPELLGNLAGSLGNLQSTNKSVQRGYPLQSTNHGNATYGNSIISPLGHRVDVSEDLLGILREYQDMMASFGGSGSVGASVHRQSQLAKKGQKKRDDKSLNRGEKEKKSMRSKKKGNHAGKAPPDYGQGRDRDRQKEQEIKVDADAHRVDVEGRHKVNSLYPTSQLCTTIFYSTCRTGHACGSR